MQAASDVISPVDGEVLEINEDLAGDASLVRRCLAPALHEGAQHSRPTGRAAGRAC